MTAIEKLRQEIESGRHTEKMNMVKSLIPKEDGNTRRRKFPVSTFVPGVYLVINPDNEFWVGSSEDIDYRWKMHSSGHTGMAASIAKHGYENHQWILLKALKDSTEEERFWYEDLFFQHFKGSAFLNKVLSASRGMRIGQYDAVTGELIYIFPSQREAGRQLGITQTRIFQIISDDYSVASFNGWTFKKI